MDPGFAITYPLLWALVLLQALLCLGMLRELQQLRGVRLNRPLPLGSRAPRFTGVDILSGRRISSASIGNVPAILLFLESACPKCMKLSEDLGATGFHAEVQILAVCGGDRDTCAQIAKQLGTSARLLTESDRRMSEQFGVYGAPAAVMLDKEGRVQGYGHPVSAEELRELFEDSVGPRSHLVEDRELRQAVSP